MKKRLRRLFRLPALFPLVLVFEALVRIHERWSFLEFLANEIVRYRVFDFLLSPSFLIIFSTMWVTAMIIGPDVIKLTPLSRLSWGHTRLRTWIDESDRHKLLHRQLDRCKPGEKVRFVSITGKSVLLPEERSGISLSENPFPRAVRRGVEFQGLVLDPGSEEAKFRSQIEDPDESTEQKRLLQRHAGEVADLLARYDRAGIKRQTTLASVQIKYVSCGLPFSLWLFEDVALMEPYHIGRREGIGNLCEFAQMIVPRGDEINYALLEDHFNNLWNHAPSRPVWPS